MWFLAVDIDILLLLSIVSSLGVVFGKKYDVRYEQKTKSKELMYVFLSLSILVGIVSGYVYFTTDNCFRLSYEWY